jgi:PleD family two-component response regulator
MWNAHEEQTSELALERIAEDLRQSPVALPDGEQARLTFSGGTCRWKPGEDVRALILRADRAVYQAKAEGGNTVVHLD